MLTELGESSAARRYVSLAIGSRIIDHGDRGESKCGVRSNLPRAQFISRASRTSRISQGWGRQVTHQQIALIYGVPDNADKSTALLGSERLRRAELFIEIATLTGRIKFKYYVNSRSPRCFRVERKCVTRFEIVLRISSARRQGLFVVRLEFEMDPIIFKKYSP